jgi:hypothetical protein
MPRPTVPVISADDADAAVEAAQQEAKRRKPEPAEESDDSAITGDVVEAVVNVISELLSDS